MLVSNQLKQIEQHLLASLCLALYWLRNQKTFNPLFRRYQWSLFFSWSHAQYQPSHSYVLTIQIHMDMGARYASFLVARVPHKPSSFIALVAFLFNSWIPATSSFRLDCGHKSRNDTIQLLHRNQIQNYASIMNNYSASIRWPSNGPKQWYKTNFKPRELYSDVIPIEEQHTLKSK